MLVNVGQQAASKLQYLKLGPPTAALIAAPTVAPTADPTAALPAVPTAALPATPGPRRWRLVEGSVGAHLYILFEG